MQKFREKVSAKSQIRLRPDRDVENTFRAYETSWETERLDSEQNRQIFCEFIDLGRKGNLGESSEISDGKITKRVADKLTFDDNDSDDEGERVVATVDDKAKWWTRICVEANRPKTLVDSAAEKLGKSFVRSAIDERVTGQDAMNVGLNIDVNLQILNLLELNNETFWKRLVKEKLNSELKFQKLSRTSKPDWKRIGVELKLSEYIESLPQADFGMPTVIEKLQKLTNALSMIVEDLTINKLQPRLSHQKNEFNEKARIANFPDDECYHGSLHFLGRLSSLKRLSICFIPGILGRSYERRFFQMSVIDTENLGKALTSLEKLKNFSIRKSDLSGASKIFHLLTPLKQMKHLAILDLSCCSISSELSGESFADFFTINQSLKHLELRGNKLDSSFCCHFARGLLSFHGKLQYLGLSMNPILGNGLAEILQSIKDANLVESLDISNCDSFHRGPTTDCFKMLIELIETEGTLREIKIDGNSLIEESLKNQLVKALKKNFLIDEMSCEYNGFSMPEHIKIKSLLMRNKYFKDNPLLKKESFTAEDEVEIEKFLKRVKHPLVLKYKT